MSTSVSIPSVDQSKLMDCIKAKMRQAREEAEVAKDFAEEIKKGLTEEKKKRDEVSNIYCPVLI